MSAPPAKSWEHRLLICAALAQGVSTISNISESEDIAATAGCLRSLGAEIRTEGNARIVTGTDLCGIRSNVLHCNESGSTLRFLLPVSALSGEEIVMTGSQTLMSRPLGVYEKLFREKGLEFEREGNAVIIRGRLTGGEFSLPGDISSQFISGLLFALPLVAEDSVIRLETAPASKPYIDMTMDAIRMYGVWTDWKDDRTIIVPGGQCYKASETEAEGDWSNAAFFIAMGADVSGLNRQSVQGDKVCEEYFRALDGGAAQLDISDCPDLGPVLMAYAALRHGALLRGTDRLRFKESDRGSAMKEELEKFGVDVTVGSDCIRVGAGAAEPEENLCGHNDHRIVMALAVMCAVTGGTITGAEAVRKSFPDFFDKLEQAGVRLTIA